MQNSVHPTQFVYDPFDICFLCPKMSVCRFNSQMLPYTEICEVYCFLWDISRTYSCKLYWYEHLNIRKLYVNLSEIWVTFYIKQTDSDERVAHSLKKHEPYTNFCNNHFTKI